MATVLVVAVEQVDLEFFLLLLVEMVKVDLEHS
jgi:hypothetical protein